MVGMRNWGGGGRGSRRLVLYSSIASQLAALVRNVVVARYLGPAEFGIAATIILTVAFLDSLSNAGANNFLVQAEDDPRGDLLAAANALSLSRGVATFLGLALVVAPLVHFTSVGISAFSILAISLASLLAGGTHRGIKAAQRQGNFAPESISQLVGDIGSLLVAIPLAITTQSHLAIVAALVARSALTLAASHILAPMPYRVSFNPTNLRRFWDFGWPLLINGPLIFFSAQADRVFVSAQLGPTALGIYSAILVLVISPSTAILKWLGTIYLPVISRAFHRENTLKGIDEVSRYTMAMLLMAWLMLCGFVCVGPFASALLYGPKYDLAYLTVAMIGLLQLIRFLRAWPSTLALSVAANGGILLATIVRLIAIPIGLAGLVVIGGLKGVIAGFVAGEIVALLVSLWIVNGNASRPATSGFAAAVLFMGLSIAMVGAVGYVQPSLLPAIAMFVVGILVGTPLLAFAVSPNHVAGLARKFIPFT